MRDKILKNKFDVLAMVALAVWPFIYYWQATLRQAVFSFGDIFMFFYPVHQSYADALRQWQLPMWEPKILNGFPLFAEGQMGAFYPTHPFLYGLLPIDMATNYDILFNLAWVAVGMYLFVRILGLHRAAAFLSAFAFANGGFIIPRLQHMSVLATASWLPWILWAWEKYERETNPQIRWRWFALLGMFAGIQLLGGHPQFALLSAVLVALYSVVRWERGEIPNFNSQTPIPNYGFFHKPLGIFFNYFDPLKAVPVVIFFGLGALLAMAQLIPTFELSGLSNRAAGLLPKFFNAYSLRLPHYLMLFNPFLLGNPYPRVSVEVIGYIGFLPVLLAISAPFLKRDRRIIFFLLIALVALFLGLGDQNVFYRGMRYLPLFNYFRVPSRFFFWYTFAASMLAAFAFDLLLTRARESLALTRAQKISAGVFVVLITALVVTIPQQTLDGFLMAWVWLPIGFALFTAWILLVARRGLLSRAMLAILVVGVVMFDLAMFMAVYAKTYDSTSTIADFYRQPRVLSVLKNLSPQDGRILTSLWIYPVPETMRESLYPNISMSAGVSSAIGYTPLLFERGSLYLEHINAPMLDLNNVRYFLIPQMLPTDAQTEGADVFNEFLPEFIMRYHSFPSLPVSQVKVRSSLAQSVDWRDGEPVALITLVTQDGEEYGFQLRAGNDTAEWAYERTDVRRVIQHKMPTVATTYPALSAFPVEPHVGHAFLGQFDVTKQGQPRNVVGVYVFPLVNQGLLHIEQISFVSSSGKETSLAHLIGRDDQTMIYRDAQYVTVYENPDALPRAFLVHNAKVVRDDEATLKEMSDDSFQPRRTLILADGTPMQGEGEQRAAERVQITDYQSQRVVISVTAIEPGYLLLSDSWYPGWVARVDGVETPIQRGDYIFRAVPVSAGEHKIEFEYRPISLYVGACISAMAMIVLVALAFFGDRLPIIKFGA